MQEPTRLKDGLNAPKADEVFTIFDFLVILFRRRYWFLLVFVIVTVLVMLDLLRTTPLYEATATLGVDNRVQSTFSSPDQTSLNDMSVLNTQRELLTTNDVLNTTLKTCSLGENPVYIQAGMDAAKVLRSRIRFLANRSAGVKDLVWVIPLSLRDEDPDRAIVGLQTLLNTYLSKQIEYASDRAKLALTFLSASVAVQKASVEEAINRETAFRTEHNVLGTDPDHNQYSDRLDVLNAQQVEIDRQAAAAKSVIDQFVSADSLAGDEHWQSLLRIDQIGSSLLVLDLQKQLDELRDDQIKLQQKYLPRHPRMLEISQEIELKRQQLIESISEARVGVESNYAQLLSQSKMLSAVIKKQENELNVYRQNMISVQVLTQEVATRQTLLDNLLQRQGEEEVTSRINSNVTQIVDAIDCDRRPANTPVGLFTTTALVIGTLFGLGAALAAEALDLKVRGPKELSKLTRLTILGHIPFANKLKNLGRTGDPNIPAPIAEAYRQLYAAIRLTMKKGMQSKVLCITSPGIAEGKSTVSTRLSVTIAATGLRVLVIDADMRRPSLGEQLGESGEDGLSMMLSGQSEIGTIPTGYPNLHLIGSGIRPPNPSNLLHDKAFQALVADMRAKYDYIIIDTPPIGIVSDALAISDSIDGYIIVVRDRQTPKRLLEQVLGRLAPLQEKVLGIVLNCESTGSSSNYYYVYQ